MTLQCMDLQQDLERSHAPGSRKVAAFHMHLAGPALIWFYSLSSTDKQCWDTLVEKFREQYVPTNTAYDFCSKYYGTRTLKVKCKQRVIIQQNSECIVQGILPKHTVIGLQGVCTSSKFMSKSGLVVARSVVTVHNTDCILVKILNPSDTSVTIHRGKVLADFVTLDGSFNILPVDCHEKNVGMNVNLCNNFKKVKSQPNEFV